MESGVTAAFFIVKVNFPFSIKHRYLIFATLAEVAQLVRAQDS